MTVIIGGEVREMYGGWATRATGITDLQERLQEEIREVRWWLYGPQDGYDSCDWKELDQDERDMMMAQWEEDRSRYTERELRHKELRQEDKLEGMMIAYNIGYDLIKSYWPRYLSKELP
jgi:hypothetical protein